MKWRKKIKGRRPPWNKRLSRGRWAGLKPVIYVVLEANVPMGTHLSPTLQYVHAHVCRYKQSQQESSKLEKVRSELNKIDQLVTRDVAILRGSIEAASREYAQAR